MAVIHTIGHGSAGGPPKTANVTIAGVDVQAQTMTIAAPPGQFFYGPGANEPALLTPAIDWSPLNHAKNMEAGTILGSSGQGSWTYGNNYGDPLETQAPFTGLVSIVNDAGAPSGVALQTDFPTGKSEGFAGAAFFNNWRARFGSFSTLYLRFHHFLNANWQQHTSNTTKIMYFGGGADGNANELYPSYRSGGELQFRDQGGSGAGETDGIWRTGSSSTLANTGVWHEYEFLCEAASTPSTADGSIRIWIDGTEVLVSTYPNWTQNLVSGEDDQPPSDSNWNWFGAGEDRTWKGLQFGVYWGGNADTKTQDDLSRYGGLWVSGSV